MTYCQNCGYESHCGISFKKKLDLDGEEIEVCKQCRCELCENKPKTPWPGPGV